MEVLGRLARLGLMNYFFRPGLEFEEDTIVEVNSAGAYPTVCIELSLDGLAVNALLQVRKF